MKCKEATYLLSEYLDGQLGPEETARLEEHLARCSKCREQYEDLKNYQALISSLETKKAPDNLEQEVLGKLASSEQVSPVKKMTIPLWVKTVAAAAIIIGFVYIILPDQYFRAVEIETSYTPQVKKKGKGPAEEKRTHKGSDPRVQFIDALVSKHGGKIIEEKADQTSGITELVIIELHKKSYRPFAEEFNHSNSMVKIKETIPLSLRKKVIVRIFLSHKGYAVKDFNSDGFDDVMMHVLSGQNKGKTQLAINNREG